jgi:electron transport complex protein RnfB
MELDVYRELAEHLDRLGGFPRSETDADLLMLKELFTPEEAALATRLTPWSETAAAIAGRTGIDPAEAAKWLETMTRKGLVFGERRTDGAPVYHAVPWVVGIWEFQVNNLSKQLVDRVTEYNRTRPKGTRSPATEQMRVIPSVASVEVRPAALPYEMADRLVEAHGRFAVAPCICRRRARLHGQGCDAPEESCLLFGEFADFYIRTDRAMPQTRQQVMDLLRQADAANLVLSPSNSKRVSFICCCCGCCCGVLRSLKLAPDPGSLISSPFIASLQSDRCTGCLTCVDRCQMGALAREGDKVALDRRRCIGCGLCSSACPAGALHLERRELAAPPQMPADFAETWRRAAWAHGSKP